MTHEPDACNALGCRPGMFRHDWSTVAKAHRKAQRKCVSSLGRIRLQNLDNVASQPDFPG